MTPYDALEVATRAAMKSPCSKSKRGVVVWGDASTFVASGFNGPPKPFVCTGSDECRRACREICVHAEMRAIMESRNFHTDLLHVKVVADTAVPSGPPSCVACSKMILEAGIVRVWLLHETGLRLYSAEDFHVQSLLFNNLPIVRGTQEDK